MRAAVISRPGGPEVLELRDVEPPQAGTGEVLVRIRASALNRADLLQREGRYPAPPGWPADIPGMEIAGEVAACGPATSLWKVGDRVFGIVGGGGNAQFIVTHERTLAAIPENLDWRDAAVPLGVILGKRLTLRGTVLRARPLEEKIIATRAFAAQVVPLLASGAVRPVVDRVFPLDQIGDAHRYLESNATFGKVVIEIT